MSSSNPPQPNATPQNPLKIKLKLGSKSKEAPSPADPSPSSNQASPQLYQQTQSWPSLPTSQTQLQSTPTSNRTSPVVPSGPHQLLDQPSGIPSTPLVNSSTPSSFANSDTNSATPTSLPKSGPGSRGGKGKTMNKGIGRGRGRGAGATAGDAAAHSSTATSSEAAPSPTPSAGTGRNSPMSSSLKAQAAQMTQEEIDALPAAKRRKTAKARGAAAPGRGWRKGLTAGDKPVYEMPHVEATPSTFTPSQSPQPSRPMHGAISQIAQTNVVTSSSSSSSTPHPPPSMINANNINSIIAATGSKVLAHPIYQQAALPPFFDHIEVGPLPNSTLLKPMERISNNFSITQPLDKRKTQVRRWRKSCNPGFHEPSIDNAVIGETDGDSDVSNDRNFRKGREMVGLDGRIWHLPLGNSGSWWGGRDRSFDPPRDRAEANRAAREFRERQERAASANANGQSVVHHQA